MSNFSLNFDMAVVPCRHVRHGTAVQRASVHLKALVDIGVLEEHAVNRDRIFLHRQLLEVLRELTQVPYAK